MIFRQTVEDWRPAVIWSQIFHAFVWNLVSHGLFEYPFGCCFDLRLLILVQTRVIRFVVKNLIRFFDVLIFVEDN